MPIVRRQQIATEFRAKSDESFSGAKLSVDSKCYRSGCALAWLSIYQAVVAAVYQRLEFVPSNSEHVFDENETENLLSAVLKESPTELPKKSLFEDMALARRYRQIADYEAEDAAITPDSARWSIETAAMIRTLVGKFFE